MNQDWLMGIASHQGTIKEKNEDSFLYLVESDGKGSEIALFVVADGMGGYDIGEFASRHAINEIKNWWDKRISKILKRKEPLARILREGERAIHQINKSLGVLANHKGKKMGTTLSLLVLYQGNYLILHVGDSRIYHLRNWEFGKKKSDSSSRNVTKNLTDVHLQTTAALKIEPELLKLTEDHSWVGRQVENGLLDEESARNHPKRNVLTQCLGIEKEITPYTHEGIYDSNDLFLVCSDGFYSLFSNDEIKNMLMSLEKEYGNLQAVSDYLINFSNFAEANDNITLMLIRNPYKPKNILQSKEGLFSFFKGRSS